MKQIYTEEVFIATFGVFIRCNMLLLPDQALVVSSLALIASQQPLHYGDARVIKKSAFFIS